MAEGRVTRGTTGVNRLRRIDRYLVTLPALAVPAPLIVDLGFGARPWTTLELADRVRRGRPDARVLGLEIDKDRVAEALAGARAGVTFGFGGFEVPTPGGEPVDVIRALNVLRQYDAAEVPAAWARMVQRLSPTGVLVEGTCDELGRVASWVDVDHEGPRRFTVSLRLTGLERPGVVAERLPKVLIHRNVPGEPVHALLAALDAALRTTSPASLPLVRDRSQWLALGYARLGTPAKARELMLQREARLDALGRQQETIFSTRLRGTIALADGKTDSAVAYFRRGDAGADGLPTRDCSVCTPLFLGLSFDRGGQADSARKYLAQYAEMTGTGRTVADRWLAPVLLRLGELSENAGDTKRATEYYGRFVDLWANADPDLQPRVAEARSRIDRLNRTKR
jgi:hypothetical protein